MTGHIKLDRKILLWEWYNDINTCRLFIHLLLTANHKEGRWQGSVIGRGQLITGLKKLSENTGLTIMQLRTCFDKLKLTGEITIIITNRFRLITICKYDTYQSSKSNDNKQNNNQMADEITDEQQTSNKQVTTNNNDKNNKKNINIGETEKFNNYPNGDATEMGLPSNYVEKSIEYLDRNKQIKKSEGQIFVMWEFFKLQNFTGKRYYADISDIYTHFLRTLNNEKPNAMSAVLNSNNKRTKL